MHHRQQLGLFLGGLEVLQLTEQHLHELVGSHGFGQALQQRSSKLPYEFASAGDAYFGEQMVDLGLLSGSAARR